MDFSEVSRHSGLGCFSPDGRLLAVTDQNRIIVRDADTLETKHSFTLLDAACCIAFSPDSSLILGAQYKRRIVQVFSLRDPAWVCKIDEALAGLSHAAWAPDSRHVLTRSEFNLRLSVWSLTRRAVTHIKQPKLMPPQPPEQCAGSGVASVALESGATNVRFSHSGQFLAVLHRIECRDVLGIYSVAADPNSPSGGWDLLKQFHIDTEDCVQIEWAPDDSSILCVDSPLNYNVVVYAPSGQKLMQHSAYEHALGVKAGAGVKWSPSAAFLAVGSYDQQLRLFNSATGSVMCALSHTAAAVNSSARKGAALVLYAEKPLNPSHAVSRLALASAADEQENNPLEDASQSTSLDSAAEQEPKSARGVAAGLRGVAAGKKKPATASSSGLLSSRTKVGSKPALGAKKPLASSSSSSSLLGGASSNGLASARRGASAASSEVDKSSLSANVPTRYSVEELPLQLVSLQPAVDKPDPKLGVGLVGWSAGDRFLLARNDNTPHALWVWDVQRITLAAVLTHLDAVRCAAWDPRRQRCAIATASSKLYLWSPEGCSVVDVPVAPGANFQLRRIEWSSDGSCILLLDKNKFCCCYMRD